MTSGLREGRAEADPGHPHLHRPPARAVEQDTGADTTGRSHPGQVSNIVDIDDDDDDDVQGSKIQRIFA